jgi:lipoprotein-releasing system permease protein
MGGVFLGVSALIVVLAVMTGFQDGIRDKIIAANPHVLIMEAGGRGVANGRALAGRVTPVPGVISATPFVLQQALFTSPGGGATSGLLRGVDLDSPAVRDAIRSRSASAASAVLAGSGRAPPGRGAGAEPRGRPATTS